MRHRRKPQRVVLERAPDREAHWGRIAVMAPAPRARTGTYVSGDSWIHFCAHPGLLGIAFFGNPTSEAVDELLKVAVGELDQAVPPHRSLVDARRLTGADPDAFDRCHQYVQAHHARFRKRVTRIALVRPRGMLGAIVEGFYRTLVAPHPFECFGALGEALAWLGEAPSLEDALDRAVEEARREPPVLGALRTLCAQRLDGLSSAEASRALGVSERTLQRRLADAATSFRHERLRSRLRAAERRLLETDDSITAIALESGFGSSQSFSALFRKANGASPSAWRAQRRR